MINAGAGNDSIYNTGLSVTIDGGAGDDYIQSRGYVSINGGAGNDSIVSSSSSTINAGRGNDTVDLSNYSSNVIEYASGDGNDLILNYQPSTIRITDDSDYSTVKSGDDVIVSIGSGAITVSGAANKSLSIVGGKSPTADAIINYAIYSRVEGTDDDDYIINEGWNATINASRGNDTIDVSYYTSSMIEYSAGDGNDLIIGAHSYDTINIIDGSDYSTVKSGDDVIVSIGNGKITLKGPSNSFPVIYNGKKSGETIIGSNDDDLIEGINIGTSINTYGGNDTLAAYTDKVTLTGGTGSDVFRMGALKTSVITTYITDFTANDKLDIMSDTTPAFTYSKTSTGLKFQDTDGKINFTLRDVTAFSDIADVDVILSDKNYARLWTTTTLSAIATPKSKSDTLPMGLSLNKKETTLTVKKPFTGTVTAADYSASIKTIKASSNPNALEIIGNALDNKITASKGGSTISGGAGNDQISCGKGDDVIVYSDGDGSDVIKKFKSGDKILLREGELSNASVKGSNVILTIGDGNLTLKSALKKELAVIDADGVESTYIFTKQNNNLDSARISTNNNFTATEYWSADELDEEYYNDIFDPSANYETETIFSGTEGNDTLRNYAGGVTIRAGAGNDSIQSIVLTDYVFNREYGHVTIDGGAGNDTITSFDPRVSLNGGDGDDSVNANGWENVTLKGGAGDDTIVAKGLRNVIEYGANDGNDLIVGYDSTSTVLIKDDLNYSTLRADNDVIISISGGSMTLKSAANKTLNIVGTPIIDTIPSETLPSVETVIANFNENTLVSGTSFADSITNFARNVTIQAGVGDDTVYNDYYKYYVAISGDSGNDVIVNDAFFASIDGGSGNDSVYSASYSTIRGGAGDDTVDGYGHSKIYEYTSGDGNDLILNYNSADTVSIIDGSHYSTVRSGSDIIISVGDGSITLDNAANKILHINGTTSVIGIPDGVKLNRKGTTLTVKNPFIGTLRADDISDSIKTINASANKNAVELIGNGNDNVLKASKGGSTLEGGGGNDTITCSKGVDVIVYADGDDNDVIKKFKSGDKIRIVDGEISGASVKGSKVILSIGDGSITLKSALKKEFAIIDADGNESIYKFTKQNNDLASARISANAQLSAYWFEQEVSSDPLTQIMSDDNSPFDLPTDFSTELFNRSTVGTLLNPSQTKLQRRHSKL